MTAYFKYSMLLLNIYLQILFDHNIRSILRLLTRRRIHLKLNVESLEFIICSVFVYNLMCWVIDVALRNSFLNEHRHLVGESSWMAMKQVIFTPARHFRFRSAFEVYKSYLIMRTLTKRRWNSKYLQHDVYLKVWCEFYFTLESLLIKEHQWMVKIVYWQ